MAEAAPRILFVDHTAMLGGGELCLCDIATHFRERGCVALLADGPLRGRLAASGVRVEVVGTGIGLDRISRAGGLAADLMAAPQVVGLALRLAARGRSFDLFYANSLKSMVVAGIAGRLARRPVLWHLHDVMTIEHFSPAHLRVARLATALATGVITNSAATCRALGALGGRAHAPHVVPNGFRVEAFAAALPCELAALHAAIGLGPGPVIGVFSRLAAWKGQHVLVEALEFLPDAQALFVGDALFDGDRPYADALRHAAQRFPGRVHVLGFRDDVPALLRLCDVVALTSVAPEPFGRVVVEAMLAERPVVATSGGGAAEILAACGTGLLVPPADPHALGIAVRTLLADPAAAAAMAVRARRAAAERYALPATLALLERHVAELAGAAPARTGRAMVAEAAVR
jgi:glycosyltransferase involved in cell wall biosynthesis